MELSELSDMIDVDPDDKGIRNCNNLIFFLGISKVDVSEDGSLAAVGGKSGFFCVYLTKLPVLAAVFNNLICVLSSLTKVSIYKEEELVVSLLKLI